MDAFGYTDEGVGYALLGRELRVADGLLGKWRPHPTRQETIILTLPDESEIEGSPQAVMAKLENMGLLSERSHADAEPDGGQRQPNSDRDPQHL